MSAVKETVKTGNQSCIGRSIVNRTCDDKTICFFKFGSKFINHIIEHAFSFFITASACHTASNILITNQNGLCLNTIFMEYLFHFLQRNGCISFRFWTAIQH